MHAIESIGPILGIVAFLGLAILAFLLFQQARDIRRLREWAGRAPERAQEAVEAVQAAADASRGDGEEAAVERQGQLGAAWVGLVERAKPRLVEIDRRLPVDGRYLLGALAVFLIAAAVLTSGFGLFGGGGGKDHKQKAAKPPVAVINGTGVPALAARVNTDVIKAAGYKTAAVTNAASSFANTVVMYAPGHEAQAKKLAHAARRTLGPTPTEAMAPDVKSRASGAPLALVIGGDDAQLAGP